MTILTYLGVSLFLTMFWGAVALGVYYVRYP
jgi:hypothetical protein